MNIIFHIAQRYLFPNGKNTAVNWMSHISLTGVVVVTAALIIVLSVFNGFENLVLSLYNSFDPEIKITAVEGKSFNSKSIERELNGKEIIYSKVLEEKALLKYKNKEYIATIKGVDSTYRDVNNISNMLVSGYYFDDDDKNNSAIIGQGVSYYLSMGLNDIFNPLQTFIPNRKSKYLLNLEQAFSQSNLIPVGVFSIQADFDANYVIAPLNYVQSLVEKDNQVSAIEIKVENNKVIQVQNDLQKALGDKYLVQNRQEQHVLLHQILNSEKLAVFLILVFILILATFNITASLSMLIIEKKKDIISLSNLGMTKQKIRNLFWLKGFTTTCIGAVLGLLLGLVICLAQIQWGFIGMGGGSFVIDQYPIHIELIDIFIVLMIVLLAGAFASWISSRKIA